MREGPKAASTHNIYEKCISLSFALISQNTRSAAKYKTLQGNNLRQLKEAAWEFGIFIIELEREFFAKVKIRLSKIQLKF